MNKPLAQRPPSIWNALSWALAAPPAGGLSRGRLALRTAWALLRHPVALRHWMAVAHEQHQRGLMPDFHGDFLRLVRPYVNRALPVSARSVQLIDHTDWLETALLPAALRALTEGKAVTLADLPPPRGYELMRVQLQKAPSYSREGELLLSLMLQRDSRVQVSQPVEVAVIAFTTFRVQGKACMAVGGVRGQRHPVLRLSAMEVAQALQGWKAPVLMLRVMQELGQFWDLHLVGLDPSWHSLRSWRRRFSTRDRDTADRITQSLGALWDHFDAKRGPRGWVVLPPHSDDHLEATALSPEKRARQIQRADFWIRTGAMLRQEFRGVLQRPDPHARLGGATEGQTIHGGFSGYGTSTGEDHVHSSVLDSGPASLV